MMKYQGQVLAWVCGTAGQPAGYSLGLPIDSAPETAAQEALVNKRISRVAHSWAYSHMATDFAVDQMALSVEYTCRGTAAACSR